MDARNVEATLDHFAKAGGIVAVRAFYIWGEFKIEHAGNTLYSDEAHEYCEGCADTLLATVLPLLAADQRDRHRVSSTDLHAEDTCKHCMICGALLDYALNENGVASERDHYEAVGGSGQLLPGDAFHIARMVEAAPADPSVLRIARAALRRIPKAATAR